MHLAGIDPLQGALQATGSPTQEVTRVATETADHLSNSSCRTGLLLVQIMSDYNVIL